MSRRFLLLKEVIGSFSCDDIDSKGNPVTAPARAVYLGQIILALGVTAQCAGLTIAYAACTCSRRCGSHNKEPIASFSKRNLRDVPHVRLRVRAFRATVNAPR